MSELPIVTYPSDVLKKQAEIVKVFDSKLDDLVEDMYESMFKSDGVGLAAPQVDHSLRIFLAAPEGRKGKRYTFINPEIIEGKGSEVGPEGCLSFPGVFSDVKRYREVKVRYQDVKGEIQEIHAKKFLARIIQHEYDHLEGVLFVERLGFFDRRRVLDEYKRLSVHSS